MCGILCVVTRGECNLQAVDDYHRLRRRGPDFWSSKSIKLKNEVALTWAYSVLHLRGNNLCCEPHKNENESFLLWNGEIFDGYEVERDMNDSKYLFDLLNDADAEQDVLKIFSKVKGPWAFIFYQEKQGKLWFGRDVFGRRSLLWQKSVKSLKLSSTIDSENSKWSEVPANGIYCLNLGTFSEENDLIHFPWPNCNQNSSQNPHLTAEVHQGFLLHSPVSNYLNKTIPSHTESFNDIISGSEFQIYVEKFIQALRNAVKCRILYQQPFCKNCFPGRLDCRHSKTAILFSGGLDSAVLAALADEFVPDDESIDLLNVAFKKNEIDLDVPDRITGQIALQELQNINAHRKWNFVEINVSVEELKKQRQNTISALINPLNTVLDDSIGCAIWFAARGIGIAANEPYTCPCRIVLTGMGADEQLAGYSRHKLRFMDKGWAGLVNEIEMEISRISSRNLGRDDRVIADHGREARFPFLDENVVELLNDIPIYFKANLNLERGKGEKMLLRFAAKKLGFEKVCSFAKRAVQFGSRIAKIVEKKHKGNDIMT